MNPNLLHSILECATSIQLRYRQMNFASGNTSPKNLRCCRFSVVFSHHTCLPLALAYLPISSSTTRRTSAATSRSRVASSAASKVCPIE
jgi:hypothetical protein